MIRKLGSVTGINDSLQGIDTGLNAVSNIKSIQSGQTSISVGGGTTKNITISSVNSNNCIIIVKADCNGATGFQPLGYGVMTTSTNLLVTFDTSASTYQINFTWQIVEFNNVKSKQTGIINGVGQPSSITISSVNTSKAMLFFDMCGGSGKNNYYFPFYWAYLSSSTNIQASNWANCNFYWQVIEFN